MTCRKCGEPLSYNECVGSKDGVCRTCEMATSQPWPESVWRDAIDHACAAEASMYWYKIDVFPPRSLWEMQEQRVLRG